MVALIHTKEEEDLNQSSFRKWMLVLLRELYHSLMEQPSTRNFQVGKVSMRTLSIP